MPWDRVSPYWRVGPFYVAILDKDFDDFGEQDEFVSIQTQTKAPQAEASARGES